MCKAVNTLAIHIRGLGMTVVMDYSDVTMSANPPKTNEMIDLADMFRNLSKAYVEAENSLGAAIDVANSIDDPSTIQVLASRMNAQRAHHQELNLLAESL